MKKRAYLTLIFISLFVVSCSLPPKRSKNVLYDNYLEIKSYLLGENDHDTLEILHQKRKLALQLRKERQVLLNDIENLEKQIVEKDNRTVTEQTHLELAPDKKNNVLLGESCPWISIHNNQISTYGKKIIRTNVHLDYIALAEQMINPGKTILLIKNNKEIFITYQRRSSQNGVLCREYEIVTTINNESLIDMQTVCMNDTKTWLLL